MSWWEIALTWVGLSPIVSACAGVFVGKSGRLAAESEPGSA